MNTKQNKMIGAGQGRVSLPQIEVCYNLVADRGLGSTQELLGWSHSDVQGGL